MHATPIRILVGLAMLLISACASTKEPPRSSSGGASQRATAAATYDEKSVLGAAEGVFGKGSEGLARVIERSFQENGRPNGYIVGKEGGGAFIAGLRYGDGDLYHKIEGQRRVHWTGPSIGFDVGGDVNKSFVLVYNLYDTGELFQRFPAIEGKVYYIGGFSVNYHRSGDITLVNIRLGAGLRLGANVGYIRYTKERSYNPF